MGLARGAAVGLALTIVAACSPYNYGKEIKEFSGDIDQISVAYKSGHEGLELDRAAYNRRTLIEDRARLTLSPSCSVPIGPSEQSKLPCKLLRTNIVMAKPLWSSTVEPSEDDEQKAEQRRQKLAEVVTALKDYGQGLAAVTNAEDRAAYGKSVAQLSSSVGEIAKFVPNGAGVVAPAAINLIGWMVGTALDQQRFDTLKAAINLVGTPQGTGSDREKPIHAVQLVLGAGLASLMSERREVIRGEAEIVVWRLGPGMGEDAYRQRLAEAEALVTTLEGFRRNDPRKAAAALEKAHDALVEAVNDPSRNHANLLKALEEFQDKAQGLKTALAAAAATKKGQ